MSEMTDPAGGAFAVTPSDSATLTGVRSLYIGVSGNVAVIPVGGTTAVTFANHPVGYMLVRPRYVMATGTTASSIVALT